MPIPKEYHGREQAYVKHTILQTYLQRLFMIIGRKESVINYVDCFAGPWSEESDDLKDTSIGISLRQMKECADALKSQFGKDIKFRALYIEKDKKAFGKLDSFLAGKKHVPVEASCIYGDYTTKIDEIVRWASGNFTFFFIDPKGWKTVVSAPVLAPLLALNKVEFLINLMYDFFNRALSMKPHQSDVEALLGRRIDLTGSETSSERQALVISQYRKVVGELYGGKTTYVSVERPGMERVLYFLVYLTRHPLGIIVFKQAAEQMEMVQRVSHFEARLRAQINKSPIGDLFGSDQDIFTVDKPEDNRLAARDFLLSRLSSTPLLIDFECWSDFLEQTDLYPTDLQLAFKELAKEGRIKNLDADVSRRSKYPVKPNWSRKSERWSITG
ncbi:hypothetical protein BK659_16585 [Pseudomonas brassicacearum]|uniref:Three-Cys-motif partner protein TcmP n=1 Tax=Pseudomonas brassicacearum TaxID=930166 RepID=A0A423H4N7_9PSED|nr:three-Cys-motif partner protein TcmP [Pseudomonas brassicacearum]RON08174.1 hypothetical protein BK659_16585 [Pseudomonas brassicacearum]